MAAGVIHKISKKKNMVYFPAILIINEIGIIWFANLVKKCCEYKERNEISETLPVLHTTSSDLEQCWCKEPRQIRFYIYKKFHTVNI